MIFPPGIGPVAITGPVVAIGSASALGAAAACDPTRSRVGFTLDLDRCTGCSACAFACRIENDLPPGVSFRQVTTFNPTHDPGLPVLHLSLACNHCDKPACLTACPTGAYEKDPHTGAVVLNSEHCMGCTYCSWVCPYGALQFDRDRGVMTKCTFCVSRVERGGQPACVVACPVDALNALEEGRLPLNNACIPGFPDTGLLPAIQLISRRRVPLWRRIKMPHLEEFHWARLRDEWPLAFFTFMMAVLGGWFLGGLLRGSLPQPALFLALAALGGFVSTFHLGRPARMWRAMRNVRTSWISREVALFTAFLACAAGFLLIAPANARLGWTTAALGLASLGAMDMVYRVRGQAVRAVPHSAMTLLTALYLAGCLGTHPWLAAPAGAAKLLLYVHRHRFAPVSWKRFALPLARLLLGFAAPLVAWLTLGTPLPAATFVALLIAEALDRLEFYATLEFLSPRRQADLDAVILSRF